MHIINPRSWKLPLQHNDTIVHASRYNYPNKDEGVTYTPNKRERYCILSTALNFPRSRLGQIRAKRSSLKRLRSLCAQGHACRCWATRGQRYRKFLKAQNVSASFLYDVASERYKWTVEKRAFRYATTSNPYRVPTARTQPQPCYQP